MKLLREALLSFVVGGTVLFFYFLAAGAALFSLHGVASYSGSQAVHHFNTVTDTSSSN